MTIARLELPPPGRLVGEPDGASRASCTLSREVVEALCGDGPDALSSIPSTVLAAIVVVLRKYAAADAEEVAVDLPSPDASRSVRLGCRGDATFVSVLQAAREILDGRHDGGEVTGADGCSLLPAFFALENALSREADAPGSSVAFGWGKHGGRAWVDVMTDGAVVAPWCAEHLAAQVHAVLVDASRGAARLIADLTLLAPDEFARATQEFNQSARSWPEMDAATLFEQIVARGPTQPAIVGGGQTITYAELDGRSNALAEALTRRGLRPPSVVAVHLERSADAIAAILAVLKCGCAWLPVDPELPSQRIELMLHDARALWMVTRGGLLETVVESLTAVDIDTVPKGGTAAAAPNARRSSEAPAYVMYTSGSTGRPKAAVIAHRNLVNMALAHAERLGVTTASRILQFFSFSFDASVFEVFVPLLNGAAVVLPSRETLLNPRALAAVIRQDRVTSLQLPPSVLAELVPNAYPDLQTLLVGGEVYPARLVDRWVDHVRVVNFYGPTETCVSATSYERTRGAAASLIGTPLANVRTYVLDADRRRVPVGVPGELYIGGAGVGAGYLNRPDLTSERFVADPFDAPGRRMYRTGDRARYLPDGVLEFLGRHDAQVKVRGHRVELGEVESALAALPSVSEAAATVGLGDASDDLIAFVVADGSVDVTRLRAAAAATLPGYMVPSRIHAVGQLPRLPNGKVDRRALPGLAEAAQDAIDTTGGAPPSWLRAMVQEVVGGPMPRGNGTLFDAGAHSLHAIRIAARIEDTCGHRISLQLLLGPTLDEIERLVPAPSTTGPRAAPAAPTPDGDGGMVPLSPGQRGLWLATHAAPSTAYSVPLALELTGPVRPDVLATALVDCVRRHAPLRTRVVVHENDPVGVIAPTEAFQPRWVDLRALSADEQERQLQSLFAECVDTPFDLRSEVPLRALVAQLRPDRVVLCLVVHHIAADGWSYGVLSRDLSTLYRRRLDAAVEALPPLRTTYARHARHELAALSSEGLGRDLDWWRSTMVGAHPLTRLPLDRPRPVARTAAGDRVRVRVEADAVCRLREFGRSRGASLFAVLAAGLATVLARHGADEDVTLGTVVANRNERALEDLIGYFANPVPLRVNLAAARSFGEAVELSARAVVGALDHGHVPFDQIVHALNPVRQANASPLFQVMLVLQDSPLPLAIPNVTARPLSLAAGAVKFDLLWDVVPQSDGAFDVSLEFRTDVLDPSTTDRLLRRWLRVLEAGVREGSAPWRELAMLDPSEQEQLRRHALPRTRFQVVETIDAMFRAQAAHTPTRIALSLGDDQLGYGDLDARTSRLAHQLRALGAGPRVRVALCFERSIDLVVAIIAVLKSGSAYVPIDPRYPRERSAFILRDSAAALLLSDSEETAEHLHECGAVAMTLEALEQRPPPATEAGAQPHGPDDLAYVIYTSGTTGHPKGCCVTHRNVVRLIYCARERFDFRATDVWTLFHSYCFDFSVWEMWGALTFGARLVIVPHITARSPDAFYDLLEREGVSVLCQTPSAFAAAQQHALRTNSRLPLRYVIMGGEALNIRSLRPWFAQYGDTAPMIVNMYGITETTVHTTYRHVRAADAEQDGSFVGEPLPDLGIALLGPAGEWVPDGVPGEIHVLGDGVTAGYLNRPDLDAQRFPPDPLHPDRRWYRSGDLARRLASGDLEYLGRSDNQVKIRGFRVELGEIEACGQRHPAVRDFVAGVREIASGSADLVAWITPRSGAAPSVKAFLVTQLPEYMVPSRIMELDVLPLTATGKVDKRALPLVQTAARAQAAARRAPETDLQRSVARVWGDVLGVEEPGIDDNFFDLGGHSLLATKLVMRLEEALGVILPVRYAFEAPTVATLAELLDEMLAGRYERVHAEIGPAELLAEAVLDDGIRPSGAPAAQPPRRILLTGATGFLGAYLLAELLHTTDAEIHCLVRASDEGDALGRIAANLDRYGRRGAAPGGRLRAVIGDLARPRFGLSSSDFDELAHFVDTVVHAGAWVNFLEGYKRLQATNVGGTREVLRFACTGHPKAVHHVSTTGVFGTPSYRRRIELIREDDDIALGLGVGHMGYVQTKWVAERLVWEAYARGLPVSVYRCGLIMGDSVAGHTNLRDFPSLMIKGCLQLGACYDLRKLDNFIPVDVAASAMAHLIRKPPSGVAYHVVNPHYVALAEFWRLLRSTGYVLEPLPYDAWVERFSRQSGGIESNALYPLFSLFRERVPAAGRTVIELFEDQPRYDLTNFLAGIADSNIECPRVDEALVSTWVQFYQRIGFIAPPSPRVPPPA